MLVHTSKLRVGSMLRDDYERAGMLSSWVAVVRREPERWFYLTADSRNLMQPTPHSRAVIRSCAAQLSHLCSQASLHATLPEDTEPIEVER